MEATAGLSNETLAVAGAEMGAIPIWRELISAVSLTLSIDGPSIGSAVAAEAEAVKHKAAMTDTEQAKEALWKFFIFSC
jgi:hypothetical protein